MGKSISAGITGITALSVIGSIIIRLPLSSVDGSDILAMIIASAAGVLIFLAFYPSLSKLLTIEKLSSNRIKGAFITICCVVSVALLLAIAVFTLVDFCEFVRAIVLPEYNKGILFAAILTVAVIIGTKELKTLSKTALVLICVTLLSVAVIFLLSVSDMSLKYVLPYKLPDMRGVFRTALSVFIKSFGETLLIVSAFGGDLEKKKSVVSGCIIGGVVITLCCLNTLLVFGGGFAAGLRYPYVIAVRTVGKGEVFSGMDIFLYVAVFFTCVMKTAAAVFGVKRLIRQFLEIKI